MTNITDRLFIRSFQNIMKKHPGSAGKKLIGGIYEW